MLHFFGSIGEGEGSRRWRDLLVVGRDGRAGGGVPDEVVISGGGGGDSRFLRGVRAAVVVPKAHADRHAILDFADPFTACSNLRVG